MQKENISPNFFRGKKHKIHVKILDQKVRNFQEISRKICEKSSKYYSIK